MIDITYILKQDLAPVLLSLYHLDDQVCKTNKSVLLKKLEVGAETNISPRSEDI